MTLSEKNQQYDTAIIGGGLSGLYAATLLQQAGQRTVVFSKGAPGLAFSSGNIDVFKGENPFNEINNIKDKEHPYYKIGSKQVQKSLFDFQAMLQKKGLSLIELNNNRKRHVFLTPYGNLKSSFLIQESMLFSNHSIKNAVLVKIKGFQDFPVSFVQNGLVKNITNLEKNNIDIIEIDLEIPYRYFLLRSVDIANTLEQKNKWQILWQKLQELSKKYDAVFIPGILPANDLCSIYLKVMNRNIYEVPTSPPSVPGERLYYYLKKIYNSYGGCLFENKKIASSIINDSKVEHITLEDSQEKINAKNYILATGSFFSGGMNSNINLIEEPIFQSDIYSLEKTSTWASSQFNDFKNHAFLKFGVKTNNEFQVIKNNKEIKNLYAVGALLSGFNPLEERSAGGVSISTSNFVAKKILEKAN